MKKRKKPTSAQVMADHLRELRLRLFVCVGVAIAGGVIGYLFYQPILGWLRSPLHADLYYSSPSGSFTFIMKVATMVGIGIALPVLIYNIMMFIQPALKQRFTIARITGFTIASVFLAVIGALFAFYAILPGALKFFSGFQVSGLSALLSADSYLSFVTNSLITFMIVFQIPLLMIIFDRIAPISPQKLLSMEKYVVLAGLGVALLVPFAFDIVTCLLIAAPIIVLYNLSVVMIIIQHAQRARYAKRHHVITPEAEQTLDDQLIAEFFSYKEPEPEPAKPVIVLPTPHEALDPTPMTTMMTEQEKPELVIPPRPTTASRNLEFKRTKAPTAEEVRKMVAEQRQQALAARVAQHPYQRGPVLRSISDIR